MKILLEDSEIKEIPVLPLPSVSKDGIVTVIPSRGRKEGSNNKTQLEKEIIAIDATISDSSQKQLARVHGVSQTEVSIHSRAIDRSAIDDRKTDQELKSLINQKKFKIADVATAKLMQSLDLFSPEYLDQKDLPGAASKMASIVEKVASNFEQHAPTVNFHVYSPQAREESSFDVIEVVE